MTTGLRMNMSSTPFRFSMLTKHGLQKTARRMPNNMKGTAFRPYVTAFRYLIAVHDVRTSSTWADNDFFECFHSMCHE